MKISFAGKYSIVNGKPSPPIRDYNGELDKKIQELENEILQKKKDFEEEHNIILFFTGNPQELTAVIDFDHSIF